MAIQQNPGFFRTELLTDVQLNMLEYKLMIMHNARHNKCNFGKGANRQQPGDPSKLAKALIEIASLPEPPVRFVAGADAVAGAGHAASLLQQQAVAFRALSS